MNAKVFYEVTILDYGDDERSGWYLQRVTISYSGSKPRAVIDRKPIAKFIEPADATSLASDIHDAVYRRLFRHAA